MKTTFAKRCPWLSLTLLLVAYASFGWFLSDPEFSDFNFFIAFGWIWIIAEAFTDPLAGLSYFISRRFRSDTIAFLVICLVAGLAAVVLFWLHVFLYMLTIVATEALARLDLQTSRFTGRQAFWMLAIVSLMGLALGWGLRDLPPLIGWELPTTAPEPKEVSLLLR